LINASSGRALPRQRAQQATASIPEPSPYRNLLVETPNGNLSKGMRQLNGVYAGHAGISTDSSVSMPLICY